MLDKLAYDNLFYVTTSIGAQERIHRLTFPAESICLSFSALAPKPVINQCDEPTSTPYRNQ